MQSSIKLLLFNRFLEQNKDYNCDIDFELERCNDFFTDQSKFWGNKERHKKIQQTLGEMRELLVEYREAVAEINQASSDMLRKEEQLVIKRDYDRFATQPLDINLVLERQQQIDPVFMEIIRSEIGFLSDWRYAGLELNPSNGVLTRSMLACDPFYVYNGTLTDTEEIKSKFNNFFAEKRLFFYDDFDKLPRNGIGLATCINYYEFLPLDPIKEHLRNVFNLMMPGGQYVFTYSDCELEPGLDLLTGQDGYRCYNTKTLMESLAYSVGFDIVSSSNYKEVHSWMVVKKPGDLTSQKLSAPIVTIDK